jgi:hypothetical protein
MSNDANDTKRMADIGEAVVRHFVGDSMPGHRQATPEFVVDRIRRTEAELRSVENSAALRVGRRVVDAWTILRKLEDP